MLWNSCLFVRDLLTRSKETVESIGGKVGETLGAAKDKAGEYGHLAAEKATGVKDTAKVNLYERM